MYGCMDVWIYGYMGRDMDMDMDLGMAMAIDMGMHMQWIERCINTVLTGCP